MPFATATGSRCSFAKTSGWVFLRIAAVVSVMPSGKPGMWVVPGITGELLRLLVRTTDIVATPTELAICWLMFSRVEPRATSWAFRFRRAVVMIGIIVAPMPQPITTSITMIAGYGVVSVIWVIPNMPTMINARPIGTIRPIGTLSE